MTPHYVVSTVCYQCLSTSTSCILASYVNSRINPRQPPEGEPFHLLAVYEFISRQEISSKIGLLEDDEWRSSNFIWLGMGGVPDHWVRCLCVSDSVWMCLIQGTRLRVMTDVVCLNHLQRGESERWCRKLSVASSSSQQLWCQLHCDTMSR